MPRILLLFVLVALTYAVVMPFGEIPDEEAHFAYVEYLLSHQQLPVQFPDPTQNLVGEGHHPPVYYAVLALLTGWAPYQPYRPEENPYLPPGRDDYYIVQQFLHPVEERFPWQGPFLAVRIGRLVSIGMGVLGVWLTYRIAREVVPHARWVAVLAAGVHAFVPQFVFISAAVNNDNGAALMGSILTWQMLRLFRRADADTTSYAGFGLLGLLMGIGILCKVSLLAMFPAVFWTVLYAAWRLSRSAKKTQVIKSLILNTGLVIVPVIIVSGWWVWRNFRLYDDPIGWNIWMVTNAAFARRLPITWSYVLRFWWAQFVSFWARFSWGRIFLPTWIYLCLLALALVCVGGLTRHLFRSRQREHRGRMLLLALVLAGLLVSTWRLGLSLDMVAAQGRFLFPALSAIATLLATGWLAWWPPALRSKASRSLIGGLFALAAGALFFRVIPVYVRPFRDALPQTAQPVQSDFGGLWELVGWEAPQPVVGRTWPVTLYWRAQRALEAEEKRLDPTLFIHLVEVDGQVVAGWDGVPTQARFPPPAWSPDVIVADTVRLRIPEGAGARLAHVFVGFYFMEDGRRVPVHSETHTTLPDTLLVGPVLLRYSRAPSFEPEQPVEAQFGPGIRLLGFDLEPVKEDQMLRVVLYWRSEEEVDQDYTVFVHLIGAQGLVTQGDGPPCRGGCPTSLWQPGDVWRDEHVLAADGLSDADAPYELSVGLYQFDTGARLPALSPDGLAYEEDRLVLCTLSSWSEGQCVR